MSLKNLFNSIFVIVLIPLVLTSPVEDYLVGINERYAQLTSEMNLAKFNYYTNISESTFEAYLETLNNVPGIVADWKKTLVYNVPKNVSEEIKRQFAKFSHINYYALGADFKKLETLIYEMQNVYVSGYFRNVDDVMKKEDIVTLDAMDPNLSENNLLYNWVEIRKAIGPKILPLYAQLGPLMSNTAVLNKFRNVQSMWLDTYKYWRVDAVIKNTWKAILPLYEQLHAYVRFHLSQQYKQIKEKSPIPEHYINSGIYAKYWTNLYSISMPVPERGPVCNWNVKLKRNSIEGKALLNYVDNFFKSVGLSGLSQDVLNTAILDNKKQVFVCNAKMWNFYNLTQPRITACLNANTESLVEAAVLIGLLEYHSEYQIQPTVFQAPSNLALGIAVGQSLSISIDNMKYATQERLSPIKDINESDYINMLYMTSLHSIAKLPFYLAADTFRWQFFSGKFKPEQMNCKWWSSVTKYQGIEPPVVRSKGDFDAGVVPEILLNKQLIHYFFGEILKFQIHKVLCTQANEYNPKEGKHLHMCYLHNKPIVGEYFKKFLNLGRSRHFPTLMELIVKNNSLDTAPLLEFYNPLYKWLVQFNMQNNVTVGWTSSNLKCSSE